MKEALANGVIALSAALAKPWASVVLSGAASLATLRSDLAAAELQLSFDRDGLDELAESPEAYWERRYNLPWT